jgi:hypothetical protein
MPQCPSYAIAVDTSCAYCVNKTLLVTSGPSIGKCAARCQAGEIVFSNGTCGSCPPGRSVLNTGCGTGVGATLLASPLVIRASKVSEPVLMKAPLALAACPDAHFDCGAVCVKLPAPVLGNICTATNIALTTSNGGAASWPKCQ